MFKTSYKVLCVSLFGLSLAVLPAFAGAQVEEKAPTFAEVDHKGQKHSSAELEGKITVLEWINPDCPFVKRHYEAGTMAKLAEKYGAKGVVWMAVNSTHYMDAEANAAFAEKKELAYPILVDADGSMGEAFGARTTPHMYVIAADGTVVYQGAIDNDPRGTKESSELENYVAAALDALLDGETPAVSQTKPYGCSVKYK